MESRLTGLEGSLDDGITGIENRFTVFEARVGAILERH
jgi:hypothetical protein